MKSIWFMEGLSSQRDIIKAVKEARRESGASFQIIASHRGNRPEITSVADLALVEPKNDEARLTFIRSTVLENNVVSIHAGRNCRWFEEHREDIESLGVSLTTGSRSLDMHMIGDDKVRYARFMEQHSLPVVPSVQISTVNELSDQIALWRNSDELACIKPVNGIYGIGFWVLDPNVGSMGAFSNPDNRRVTPEMYLSATRQQAMDKLLEPMVLMPYLAGKERSVDMVVENGEVIAAVSRRKEGALQYIEQSGDAFELAKACARVMQADGLINVQTRDDADGTPFLLEINMRPSGGVCYSMSCGVNLSGIFALRQLGIIDREAAVKMGVDGFRPVVVRSVSDVVVVSESQSA